VKIGSGRIWFAAIAMAEVVKVVFLSHLEQNPVLEWTWYDQT
jgi:hypothetical protein